MKTPLDFQVYGVVTVADQRLVALASAQTDTLIREFSQVELLDSLEPETLIFAAQIYPRRKIVIQPIGERLNSLAADDPQVREAVTDLVRKIERRL